MQAVLPPSQQPPAHERQPQPSGCRSTPTLPVPRAPHTPPHVRVPRRDLAHAVPTRWRTPSSPAPREPRQQAASPSLLLGCISPHPRPHWPPTAPRRDPAPPALQPCWTLPSPALSQRRCRSSPKGSEADGAPAPEGGVTRGTTPRLPGRGGWGTRPRSRSHPGGEGGPLIFLIPNKFPPHPQGRAASWAQGGWGWRDEAAEGKGSCSGPSTGQGRGAAGANASGPDPANGAEPNATQR